MYYVAKFEFSKTAHVILDTFMTLNSPKHWNNISKFSWEI